MNGNITPILPTPEKTSMIQSFFDQGQQLEKKSRAVNTLKRYQGAFKLLQQYCLKYQTTTIPLQSEVAYTFLVHIHRQQYSQSTLIILKSAIDYYHKQAGFSSPLSHPRLVNLLEGIKRDTHKKGKRPINPIWQDKKIPTHRVGIINL